MESNDCKCFDGYTALPENPVVAMAYIPFQTEAVTYGCAEAFNNGTLFPELNLRFFGGKCCGE